MNLRDEFFSTATELERTTTQRIFEVIDFKVKHEKKGTSMSVVALSKAYDDGAKLANKSEKVDASFLESAISIWTRLLSIDECRSRVLDVEISYLHRCFDAAQSHGL